MGGVIMERDFANDIRIEDVVSNARVYDLKESIMAAGYPMKTSIMDYNEPLSTKDFDRMVNLIKATEKDNQAHGQFLSGIRVNFDLTFSNKAWVEMERYRFVSFVSSQSTMHRIVKFDIDSSYNNFVDPRMIQIMRELITAYEDNPTKENYLKILYSNPSGFKITARLATNYRCLRNIYKQRKNHRLPEWRVFCKWIETLPYAAELLIN